MFGILLLLIINQGKIKIRLQSLNRATTKIPSNLHQSIRMAKNVTIANPGLQMAIKTLESKRAN
jgi:hypothetical protein